MAMIGRKPPPLNIPDMTQADPSFYAPPMAQMGIPPVGAMMPPPPPTALGNAMASMPMNFEAQAEPQAAPSKPGINWLGVLADALSGAAGQPGQFAQRMERQRQEQTALERGEQQYRRQRADARSDDDYNFQQQIKMADHKRANPDDEFTRMLVAAGVPKEQWPAKYGQMLERKLNPPTFVPGVGLVQMNGGAAPTAGPAPLTDDDIDGMGGAGPQAPRPFPY